MERKTPENDGMKGKTEATKISAKQRMVKVDLHREECLFMKLIKEPTRRIGIVWHILNVMTAREITTMR